MVTQLDCMCRFKELAKNIGVYLVAGWSFANIYIAFRIGGLGWRLYPGSNEFWYLRQFLASSPPMQYYVFGRILRFTRLQYGTPIVQTHRMCILIRSQACKWNWWHQPSSVSRSTFDGIGRMISPRQVGVLDFLSYEEWTFATPPHRRERVCNRAKFEHLH